jgi:hypothetical protein
VHAVDLKCSVSADSDGDLQHDLCVYLKDLQQLTLVLPRVLAPRFEPHLLPRRRLAAQDVGWEKVG